MTSTIRRRRSAALRLGARPRDAMLARVYETFDLARQDQPLAELHAKIVDDAQFLFIAHDMNPRAMSRRVRGFVQAQSWFQDLTPISMS